MLCDWESNHNSAKFLILLFFFRSPRSSALIHIERVFPDYFSIFTHAKFCFRHTTNIFRKESNSILPPFKKRQFYVWYICVTCFTLKLVNRKKTCSFFQENIFLEIVRWYINFYVHHLWEISVIAIKLWFLFLFFCFSSKRHQPMPWSLYTFKYTIRVLNARETFEEKHRLHRALLSLNISKSIYLLLLCIKCATRAIIMQYQ